MNQRCDVLVIGAGPAGLSAASAAAEQGLSVLLLDDQPFPGGQFHRSVGHERGEILQDVSEREQGLRLVARMERSGAEWLPGSAVWFAEPGRAIYSRGGTSTEVRARCIIAATGAMERPVPFRGWTLPGVMGAGGADILLRSGVVPTGPMVLAGNGPLLPLLGSHLLYLGVPIAGLLDTGSMSRRMAALPFLPAALLDLPYLGKGLGMAWRLWRERITTFGVTRISAEGSGKVEEVRFTANGRERRIPADLLITHEGIIPRTHLSRLMGLRHVWDPRLRCWRPLCDENGGTSAESILLAGDGATVDGGEASARKGELAGIEAARRLGVLSCGQAEALSRPARAGLRRLRRARAWLSRFFVPRKGLFDVEDDVVVCRCENVTAGQIRQAAAEGCYDINDVKLRTRSGMGQCQSRMCGTAAAEIAAARLGVPTEHVNALSIRPPIRPVNVAELCFYTEDEDRMSRPV